jgi:hypothetical protein
MEQKISVAWERDFPPNWCYGRKTSFTVRNIGVEYHNDDPKWLKE